MDQNTNGVKTWQWVVTVVVIIALIVIGIMVFGSKKTEAPVESNPTASVTTGSIVVGDQFPGNKVYISSITSSSDAWVSIQKDNAGTPGDLVGYSKVTSGTAPLSITLTKPTLDGSTYDVVLRNDDGDGSFDLSKDIPVTDTSGNIIMGTFKASINANKEVKG